MNVWHDIDSSRINPHDFLGYIEIPRGSKCKYELDKASGVLILDRILYTSVRYPMSYGFIPRTLGDDDDPLDIVVLCDEAISAGCLVRCYPIGVIAMVDNGRRDEKIISIPFGDPNYNSVKQIGDLPNHRFAELMHFFEVYKELEDKENSIVDQIMGPPDASRIILESIDNYKNVFGSSNN